MSHQDWGTPELRALRGTTTEFGSREALPYQDQWEREGSLPRALSLLAGQRGLWGFAFPESAGGGFGVGGGTVEILRQRAARSLGLTS